MKLYRNITRNKRLKKDVSIICLIIIAPFCFFIYNIVPEGTNNWTAKWFTIDAGYFEDVDYYIWLLFVKGLTISVLSLWYISCTYWWRSIIFIPIVFEFYKVYSIVDTAMYHSGVDKIFFIYSLLFSIPFILLLYFIGEKLNYYKQNNTVNEELNTEINGQIQKLSKFNSKDYKLVEKELQFLLEEKDTMPKKEYLAKIIVLRDRLTLS